MKCCEQYAAALSAFVDGELSENEKEEVFSHVEHCQNCHRVKNLIHSRAFKPFFSPQGNKKFVQDLSRKEVCPLENSLNLHLTKD